MKQFLHVLIVCLGLNLPARAQLQDSLESLVGHPSATESEKAALLNLLAERYRVSKNYDTAAVKARQSAAIALHLKNYTEVTKAYTLLLNVAANTQQFAGLKQLSDSVMYMAHKANDPVAMAYANYARVLFYKSFDDAENMVRYCQAGLKLLEQKADPYLAGKLYYQLYAVNSNWNHEANVNRYARLATENALKTTDYSLQSNCYTALSVAHEYNYNTGHDRKELDSVLYYLALSEQLYRQHPGQVMAYTYGIACVNIASYYLKYFPQTDSKAKAMAIQYATTARRIVLTAPNSEEVIASSLGILSEYARKEGREADAENYLLEAYKIMLTTQNPYYYTLINITQSLSNFYRQQGNYQKALDFQKEVTEYSNKSFNQQQELNTQRLEVQYETEKKEREVLLLKEREKSRSLQNYLYGGIALASLLGLIFMFRSYHFRLRYAMQREKQLQLEKKDNELQIKLEKEEQARLKVEQQLLATQQQQLKKEVMANVLQLEHKNKVLLHLKDKLSDSDPVHMQKLLKEEMVLDSDFEQAKLQIQQVHPGFFQLLGDKAQRKLTMLDLKLCAYLYLQMDTRQIAQLMNVEAKSVRMSRYRIKQKLGLDKNEDLNTFLQTLQ